MLKNSSRDPQGSPAEVDEDTIRTNDESLMNQSSPYIQQSTELTQDIEILSSRSNKEETSSFPVSTGNQSKKFTDVTDRRVHARSGDQQGYANNGGSMASGGYGDNAGGSEGKKGGKKGGGSKGDTEPRIFGHIKDKLCDIGIGEVNQFSPKIIGGFLCPQ